MKKVKGKKGRWDGGQRQRIRIRFAIHQRVRVYTKFRDTNSMRVECLASGHVVFDFETKCRGKPFPWWDGEWWCVTGLYRSIAVICSTHFVKSRRKCTGYSTKLCSLLRVICSRCIKWTHNGDIMSLQPLVSSAELTTDFAKFDTGGQLLKL